MYAKGHSGLTLFIMSTIMMFFPYSENGLIIIVLSASLSALPDLDLKWQRQGINIRHRGPTHSILAAIIAGIGFGFLFWYGYKTWIWGGIGFFSGFMGVTSHLIGDAFTHHAFKPLWPFSNREIALHLTRASNKAVNEGLATLGTLAFMLYFLNGTGVLTDLLNIFL
ncbi:MAG: metal-dependent hydrolase [Candidatus Bathyarchaeota archaeon]|nr:metal-dependent hydrolase [Candidatus Bathyarchaeota archaeon]